MTNNGDRCGLKCWVGAGAFGFLVLLFGLGAGKGLFAALILGAITFVLLGLLFCWLFCGPEVKPTAAKTVAASAAPMPQAAPAPVVDEKSAMPEPVLEEAPVAAIEEPAKDAVAEQEAAEQEADETLTEATLADVPPAEEVVADEPTAVANAPSEDAETSVIQPSAELAGEKELAERKGEWRYSADAADAADDADAADAADAADLEGAETDAEIVAAEETPSTAGDQDYDGDGVLEGSEEGRKPALLAGPRDGKADNLKEIKGIGPKLEAACNDIGVYHFDQIAAWSDDEVAWVNANLIGFKGRVTRDKWVDQAKVLAAGGETEFSKRVDSGKVY
jgi:predicted flap endonuclease-1-like 5' DNA nuclease